MAWLKSLSRNVSGLTDQKDVFAFKGVGGGEDWSLGSGKKLILGQNLIAEFNLLNFELLNIGFAKEEWLKSAHFHKRAFGCDIMCDGLRGEDCGFNLSSSAAASCNVYRLFVASLNSPGEGHGIDGSIRLAQSQICNVAGGRQFRHVKRAAESKQHVVADDETTEWLIATIRGEHVELDEWEAWRLGPCHLFQGCLRKQKWRALTQEHLLGSQQSNVKIKSLAQDLLGTV